MTKSVKKAAPTRSSAKAAGELILVTADAKVTAQVGASASKISGLKFSSLNSGASLISKVKPGKGVLLLDESLPDWNSYELCRRYKSNSATKVFILLGPDSKYGEGIAKFCGADGVVHYPTTPKSLQEALHANHADVKIDELLRKAEKSSAPASFPEMLLKDAAGEQDRDLVDAIIDPETKLFNYAFLAYKLDEEFKRAMRFKYPLSCVMLGFDGEASSDVLLDLAGIFLSHSRDTDVLGRFDLSSFLFLLPNTGVQGAKIMAERVMEAAGKKKLKDLVGEPLEISVGISYCPHSNVAEREELFERARKSFESASNAGGGVKVADA